MSPLLKSIFCCFFSKKSENIKDVIDPTSIEFLKKDELNISIHGGNIFEKKHNISKCNFCDSFINTYCSKNEFNNVDIEITKVSQE
jgi:hypothetical protein